MWRPAPGGSSTLDWVDSYDFPVVELVKRDCLPAHPADKVSRLEQLLAFFGVASVDAWDEVYSGLACAFRTTQAFETKCGALVAWLRLGEIAAQDVECAEFDRTELEATLLKLRALTREPVDVFCQQMRALCADCGVAVVFVPELSGARASGVMRLFSRDTLIPPRDARELPRLRSDEQVRGFAERLGIAPGIVVGRLQHDGIWPHSRGNQLKRQLSFGAAGDDSQPCR